MKQETVVVGLSGGVDSAVAAFLLKKQGFRVIGAFMKNFSDTKDPLTGECHWVEDKKEAEKIASILEIPLITFDFEKEYKKYVIQPMISSYKRGLTPNPDVLCNKIIKFPLFWKEAKKLGADYIAMGHYIRKEKKRNKYYLFRGKDEDKDQSYFLYELTQEDLQKTLFPIGDYTKEEIRKIAKKASFPNWNRKSTSGICFVGQIDLKEFLRNKIKQKKGKVLTQDGKEIGNHEGIMYYTVGERVREKEIKINKEYRNEIKDKLYILDKKNKKNILVVGPRKNNLLNKNSFKIININWITEEPKLPIRAKVRIRHLGELLDSEIKNVKKQVVCNLNKKIEGLAEGQSVIIYNKKQILGGGEISF